MPTTFATFLLEANKSLRATTRYIDLFPPAITVKLARHFVLISATTAETYKTLVSVTLFGRREKCCH